MLVRVWNGVSFRHTKPPTRIQPPTVPCPPPSPPHAQEGEKGKEPNHVLNFDLNGTTKTTVPKAFTAIQESFSHSALLGFSEKEQFPVVWDTGASCAVTPHREHFLTYTEVSETVIKGLAKGCSIKGKGTVRWAMDQNDGTTKVLEVQAAYVPDCSYQLLSPQLWRRSFPRESRPRVEVEDEGILVTLDGKTFLVPYDPTNNLPTSTCYCPHQAKQSLQALNVCVTDEANQNLTVAQKHLLKLHYKHGHRDMAMIQRLVKTGALGQTPLLQSVARCTVPKCASCQFAKARRRKTQATSKKDVVEAKLSKEELIPGSKVSMDHFSVTQKGRLYTSKGLTREDTMYSGGVVFVDHASSYVHVEPVVNFTATEALRAKREFEREMESMGVTVVKYHTDNGVFTAREYQDKLAELHQDMTLSGTGAHHQNAVAERAIGTIANMARTMMLHAKVRWPKHITPELWPMAMEYAAVVYNSGPKSNNVAPVDLLLRTTVPRQKLNDLHVWGSPVYVLEPKLQDGKKIPKFDPRSRQGIFLGFSKKHALTVPSVLNLQSGSITAQFHVVFDDWFATVKSMDPSMKEYDSKIWDEILLNNRFYVEFDEDEDPIELSDDWLTEAERLERHNKAVNRVWEAKSKDMDIKPSVDRDSPRLEREKKTKQRTPPPAKPKQTTPTKQTTSTQQQRETPQQRESIMPTVDEMVLNDDDTVASVPEPEPPPPPQPDTPNRRQSTRTRRQPKRFKDYVTYVGPTAMALASSVYAHVMAQQCLGSDSAYAMIRNFHDELNVFEVRDVLSFAASVKKKYKKGTDPDLPTFEQAMSSNEAPHWMAAMKKEIDTLTRIGTWTVVRRAMAKNRQKRVLKSTWAFRKKRLPDGSLSKYKARFCVRGDMQVEGEDYFESYAPVVQWSTVRLMLILSMVYGMETRQVDYVNAFAQADLDEEVYIELPRGYAQEDSEDCVLKLNKSLYGMVQAPVAFFRLLRDTLVKKHGFKQMENLDPCLFVREDMVCLCYVDDCLWFSLEPEKMDAVIENIDKNDLTLTVESQDVSAFLGIQFSRYGKMIELTQFGLIDRVIKATGMEKGNVSHVPARPEALGSDKNGEEFSEEWSYPSVIGMLLYLASNSRPDIAFAVHQCARFTHAPKACHGVAVKKIVRYLLKTREKGLRMRPTDELKLDCYVDADFAGLWGCEDPEDPIVSKSRTGYIFLLAGCPLLWSSKLQTETAMSTMMSEYIALSQAMRDLLPLKNLVKSVAKAVSGMKEVKATTMSEVFEDNNGALTLATAPRLTPQSKFFAVKYHFFREQVGKTIDIKKIETKEQLADIFTKGLSRESFEYLRDKLMGWTIEEPASRPTGSVASTTVTGLPAESARTTSSLNPGGLETVDERNG